VNKKSLYLIVSALVIVIVAASAGVLLLQQNNSNPNQPTTTPTPTPVPVNIPAASSLAFSVNDTSKGTTTTYRFTADNMGTPNVDLRVEVPGCDAGLSYVYLFNAATRSAYNQTNGGQWVTDDFNTAWPLWGNMWSTYVNQLNTWNSTAQYSYTASNGDPIIIFDISVNPSLPASTFQAT
jgi:hypothetical protein